MEVVTPVTSYLSIPSTPKKHSGEHFLSAPTSPRRISEFYNSFHDAASITSRSVVALAPFDWGEKPGMPKSPKSPKPASNPSEDDFAFDVIEETEKCRILPAEELFDCGRIRPFMPPPYIKLRSEQDECQIRKRLPIPDIRSAFLPKNKKEFDPFGKQVPSRPRTDNRSENERGRERVSSLPELQSTRGGNERRRERVSSSSSPHELQSSGRREAISVSPHRASKYPWGEDERKAEDTSEILGETPNPFTKNKRKWRLKDLFLFRSASEGRAADRDPLRKYTRFFTRRENVKYYSSFRSVEGFDSGSSLRRRRRVSAHELHYTVNRAVSEDLKKKTFLPYKQGILGRLAFNPAVHALANGFGFSRK